MGVSHLASIECLENINVGYTNLTGELMGWVLHLFSGNEKLLEKVGAYVPCYEVEKGIPWESIELAGVRVVPRKDEKRRMLFFLIKVYSKSLPCQELQ